MLSLKARFFLFVFFVCFQILFYISFIDRQNERVKVISEDIARHDQMVQDIKALLLQQSVELLKVTQDNIQKKSKFQSYI